jgi:hypothetical protein
VLPNAQGKRGNHGKSRGTASRKGARGNMLLCATIFLVSDFLRICFTRAVRIATEYQIQDFDVFPSALRHVARVGAKPSVEV